MVAVIIIQQAPCHHSPLPPLKKGRMKERKHGDHPARYKKCSEQATQRGRSCEPCLCQDTKERAGSASRAASLALAPAPSPRHPPSEERHLAPAPPHARAPAGQSQHHPHSEAAERLLLRAGQALAAFFLHRPFCCGYKGTPGRGKIGG